MDFSGFTHNPHHLILDSVPIAPVPLQTFTTVNWGRTPHGLSAATIREGVQQICELATLVALHSCLRLHNMERLSSRRVLGRRRSVRVSHDAWHECGHSPADRAAQPCVEALELGELLVLVLRVPDGHSR